MGVTDLARVVLAGLVVWLWLWLGASGAAAQTSRVVEFSQGVSEGTPAGIVTGPDGNLWFTAYNGNRIGRITPAGAVTEFPAGLPFGGLPAGIARGPDGNLWFAVVHVDRIGRITPAGVVTHFSSGISANADPQDIVAGADGNLWFSEYSNAGFGDGNRIGRITPGGVVTEFSTGITAGAGPLGIALGPDGNVWFTEFNGNRIGRITPNGTVTEFSAGISANAGLRDIAAGPDGNLWFTESLGHRIGRITPLGVVTEFSVGITPGSSPWQIAAGPDGHVWFTEPGDDRIGRITRDGIVSEFSAGISADAGPVGITAGPDGNLWFTEFSGNRIGRITTTPPAPAPRATNPGRPANDNAPRVTGSAEPGTTVRLYGSATCAGQPAAQGSAASFAAPGLPVAVADDSSTTSYASALDAAGSTSTCSPNGVEYREDSSAPQTTLTAGPSEGATTTLDTVTFEFTSDEADSTFRCQIDSGPSVPCSSPHTTAPLSAGSRSFSVVATDVAGNSDPTPAVRTFTFAPVGPPPPLLRDTDHDTVPDVSDNCPDVPNTEQADRDTDQIGDACEVLPPGDAAVVAGTTARVEQVSGDVYVKPAPGASVSASLRRARARAAQGAPMPGFVPLKGVASVPVGSTIDARKGQLALTTAADFTAPSARNRRVDSARFSAGLFAIRQARNRRAAGANRPSTDLVLRTPPGYSRACAPSSGLRPLKGVVRTLSGTGKGRFRSIAGASITTVTNGTWATSDRCSGTLTEVGRGRARVFDRVRNRTVTVKAGQAYLARARLFAARKAGY